MAIDRDLRDRLELEQDGYRSARCLSEAADWLFWDNNMERAMQAGYFERTDNGTLKPSYYYKLTSKGRGMLKRAGAGFTYGDAKRRKPIYYQKNGSWHARSIKVTPKERRELAARLLGAFKVLVTAQGAHDQLALEKKGWFPSKTTSPSGSLIDAGLVEQMNRGKDNAVYYYRLTARGKKVLVRVRMKALLREQAAERRRLPGSIDVRDWRDLPGWQD
jgi:DNA-binding PadR family transcriptional regulator